MIHLEITIKKPEKIDPQRESNRNASSSLIGGKQRKNEEQFRLENWH